MDLNFLISKLHDIDDEKMKDALVHWVSDKLMPDLVMNNVKLKLATSFAVDCDGTLVGGYFTDDPSTGPEFALALGNSSWIDTMIHEHAHLTQWVDNAPCWTAGELGDGIDASILVDYWFAHLVELNDTQLTKYFNALIDVEIDAERRAMKMIRKYKIPIDLKLYARKANAYVLGYHEFRRRRSWYVAGKAPYHFEEVLKVMPEDLQTLDYHDDKFLTPKLRKLYDACFDEKGI